MSLLTIRDLAISFTTDGRSVPAVRNLSFSLATGEVAALVGESGSGKSVTALSVLQLLPSAGVDQRGSIKLDGTEMIGASPAALRAARGVKAAMVFQEPMTALNPLHGIGRQIGEILRLRCGLTGAALARRIGELLDAVELGALKDRLHAYPHELSGGQRQRVMIAMALAADPKLIIADEPTTALDVTVEGKILELLTRLVRERGLALLLITHNLSIVRRHADRVMVMTQGELVEDGPTEQVFTQPHHPYTRHLLAAEPSGQAIPLPAGAPALLTARQLTVRFPLKRGVFGRVTQSLAAVDRVDLDLARGETLGIIGESGSGKSTLGLALLRLVRSDGAIAFDGRDLRALSGAALRAERRRFQVVFQDPFGSLSPRLTVGDIIGEGLAAHGIEPSNAGRLVRVRQVMAEVGLDPTLVNRFPHEFSGGQRQRIAIARALALDPDLVLLDEPTSALDRSVQAQVIALLRDLQAKRGLSFLFISHDLKVVKALAHRVMVLRRGQIVESGPTEQLVAAPQDPYTKALIAAAFTTDQPINPRTAPP